MRAFAVFLLAACSKSSPCPTADELAKGSEVDRREIQIVVDQCRADDWSTEVTDCLRAAPTHDKQEPCFKQLTKDQQKRLEAAFDPIVTENRAVERVKVRDRDKDLGELLDKLGARTLATRAPACQGYLDAIDVARRASLACVDPDVLWTFGLHQIIVKDVKGLIASETAELPAACERTAARLADFSPCNAK
jgi:hypothetical protein